jgi:DNA-binding transcriptional LysR family regulator
MIEIRHLRLVDAIWRLSTLSAAARELGYSQSAVTQQLQLLERQLETPIVVRTGRGVRLTAAGEVLARHAANVLPAMARAESEVAAVAALRGGRIRLVAFPSAAAALLPEALSVMGREFPGIEFTLVEAEPPRALQLLRQGECDIALVFEYSTAGDEAEEQSLLQHGELAMTLIEEEVQIAMSPDNPLARRRWVELGALKEARWIAGCPECRGNLVDACRVAGFVPEIAFETDDFVALLGLAGAGMGVALVPDLMLAAARGSLAPELRRLSPLMTRTVSAVVTEGMLKVPGVRETVTVLRRAAQELGTTPVR